MSLCFHSPHTSALIIYFLHNIVYHLSKCFFKMELNPFVSECLSQLPFRASVPLSESLPVSPISLLAVSF